MLVLLPFYLPHPTPHNHIVSIVFVFWLVEKILWQQYQWLYSRMMLFLLYLIAIAIVVNIMRDSFESNASYLFSL